MYNDQFTCILPAYDLIWDGKEIRDLYNRVLYSAAVVGTRNKSNLILSEHENLFGVSDIFEYKAW